VAGGLAEAGGGEFGADLIFGEFHGDGRADGEFALVEVDDDDAAAGFEGGDGVDGGGGDVGGVDLGGVAGKAAKRRVK